MNEENDVIFSEVQRFRQLWVWGLAFLPFFLILWHFTVERTILKYKPLNPEDLIINLFFGILIPVFMYIFNLRTEIRKDGLYFRFFPFHLSFHKIDLDDIEKYEIRTYKPIQEYGGWGLRYSLKYGKAYNVSGNRGIQVLLKNGQNILFGSQKPEEFSDALGKVKGFL